MKECVSKNLIHIGQILALAACIFSAHSVYAQPPSGCTPPTNPIVCENSLTGNTGWDVSGAGDLTIQGFATDISVNQGQTVHFKVKTTASTYRIEIFRLGYYNGAGARRVTTISNVPRQNQPACNADGNTGLVDCGNWQESASWAVPSNATSGIYLAKLIRSDNGGASHIVFIVRADNGGADILFKTSDTTWQAYNGYTDNGGGPSSINGNSLYYGSPAGRAYKISYNRPFTTRANASGYGLRSFLFDAEYPMIRWLEANGYNVSYFTSVDTERYPSEILNHKIFLPVGHDEYWSAGMRANVEAARAAGIHLAFFTGDQIVWKTRWENSIDGSNTPFRTLVCYKETHANAVIDPQDPPTWTGTWRDPRFSPPGDGGRPENALTGSIYTVNGQRYDSMTITSTYSNLRFWRNTAIASLSPGNSYITPPGTLGHEWQEDLDNGFRPAGDFDMSSTTIDVSPYWYLLDYGNNFGSGVATHSLTLYRASRTSCAPSNTCGALVFNAGTIQWSWALDTNHDTDQAFSGTLFTDVNMQQATVNLFADMGVQPLTLVAGLVPASMSTDTVAPTSAISSPAAGANLQSNNPVTISGTANDVGGVLTAVEVSTDGGTTWHRATPQPGWNTWSFAWTPAAVGQTTIKSRAVDDSGNLEVPSAGVTVNVVPDTTPPVITSVQASPVTNSWATITWSTNKQSDSQVEYGTTSAYGSSTTLDSTLVTSHSVLLGGLASTTLYHYRVKSRDVSGNLGVSPDFTLTTTSTNQTINVTFDSLQPNQVLNGQYPAGVIDWGTGNWVISGPWGAFSNNSFSFNGPNISSASFTFLSHLRLLSLDAYNGGSGSSTITLSCPGQSNKQVSVAAGQVLTISTGWNDACSPVTISSSNGWNTNFNNLIIDSPPGAPPVISGVQSSGITCGGATITWTTDRNATSQVDYGTTSSYGTSTPLDSTLVTSHSVLLSQLLPSTLYHYRADSRDSAGNPSSSGDFTLTTSPANPNPPAISGVQAVAVSNSSAYITWNTDTASSTQVNYGTTSSYGSSTPLNSTPVTSHTVLVSGLAANTLYHYRVLSTDVCGSSSASSDFTLQTASTPPLTIWSSSATPSVQSNSYSSPIEVGVRFTSDVSGYVTGVRFYKGSLNGGQHIGNLWTGGGAPLASMPFGTETGTGWQQVNFPSPVPISAGTVYVASYHTNVGGFSDDIGYFASAGFDNPPLHALRDGASGGSDGLYINGASAFPTNTYNSTNYWVDVVFVPSGQPISVSVSPTTANVQTGTGQQFTATVHNTPNTNVTWQVNGVTGGDSTHGTSSTTGLYTAPASVPNPATVTVTAVSQADPTKSGSATVTVAGSSGSISGVQAAAISNSGAYILWNTSAPANSQVDYGTTTAYGSSTPLDSTSVTNHSVTLTSLASVTLYHYRVRSSGTVSGDFTFTTTNAAPFTIWSSSVTPAVINNTYASGIEVGVRFTSDAAGYITGLRFYKGNLNTGQHIGNLWTGNGSPLASVPFANETPSGWQQVNFSTPIAIAANTTYVASYHTNVGRFSNNLYYFANSGVDNPPLHALRDGVSGADGLYLNGPSAFPTNTYNSTNYWVDVVFVPSH